MAILITGGAGFIGSAVAASLLAEGVEDVVLLDNFETLIYDRASRERNLRWVHSFGSPTLVEADLRDAEAFEALLDAHDIEGIIHLAAVAGVRSSISLPDVYMDINVTATARMMRIAQARGVRRFTLASSSSVYGMQKKTPFSEDDPIVGQASPYGASKYALEMLARAQHHLAVEPIDVSCLRFFTVYGPRQRPDMAFHKFMTRIDQDLPIPVFGDGSSGRDYTYIDDIVSGVLAAYRRNTGFNVYNLGGDEFTLLREVIEMLGEVTGKPVEIDRLPNQPGDVPITTADLTRSRALLGFEPTTSLRAGLEAMWAWFESERR